MSRDTRVNDKISQKLNIESCVEWIIEDIFCDAEVDTRRDSPRFSIPGSEWYLQLYPNGELDHSDGSVESEQDSDGWIGLYVVTASDDSIPPIEVNYDLGVKKVDGEVEVIESDASHVFKEKDRGWGISEFLQKSELSERKSELAPSGALTVTCTMRVMDALDSTSRLMELSDNFKNMFLLAKGCDAKFKVKNEEFPVHKSVLASRSPVFKSMFEADMKENSTGTIDIVDCDPKVFKDFLVYMYSGQFKVSSGDAFELYKTAHRYCVEELKSACIRSILSNLSVDNVVDVAILGDQFDENALKCKSQDLFNEKCDEVFSTDAWISLLGEKPSLANRLLINMKKSMKSQKGEWGMIVLLGIIFFILWVFILYFLFKLNS